MIVAPGQPLARSKAILRTGLLSVLVVRDALFSDVMGILLTPAVWLVAVCIAAPGARRWRGRCVAICLLFWEVANIVTHTVSYQEYAQWWGPDINFIVPEPIDMIGWPMRWDIRFAVPFWQDMSLSLGLIVPRPHCLWRIWIDILACVVPTAALCIWQTRKPASSKWATVLLASTATLSSMRLVWVLLRGYSVMH